MGKNSFPWECSVEDCMDFIKEKNLSEEFSEWIVKR
jgi:hypothetical protein